MNDIATNSTEIMLRRMAESRIVMSSDFIPYYFAKVDYGLAKKIALFLSERFDINTTRTILWRAQSLCFNCKYRFNDAENVTNAQLQDVLSNQAQSSEHSISFSKIDGFLSAAKSPAFDKGQNIENNKAMVEAVSRDIVDKIIKSKSSLFSAIGTLVHAELLMYNAEMC
jgi:hypothetical protein